MDSMTRSLSLEAPMYRGTSAEYDYEVGIYTDVIREHAEIPGLCDECATGTDCSIVTGYRARLQSLGQRPAVESAPQVKGERNEQRAPQAGAAASNQFGTFKVHAASEAQQRFVKRLLAERDTSALESSSVMPNYVRHLTEQVQAGTLNKKAASRAIEDLLSAPERGDLPPAEVAAASDKQMAFVKRLLGEKDLVGTAYDVPLWRDGSAADHMTKDEASANITNLMALPKRALPPVALESGIYLVGETIYKVYKAQSGSHMLAKELVVTDDSAQFQYRGGAGRFVPAGTARMTLEQAKQFGAIYGVCCNCGATLTDETSIEAGIGPVCAKRFG